MKIEISSFYDNVRSHDINCLVIDSVPFTWGVLPESLRKVKEAIRADPTVREAIMMDIQNHMLKSLAKATGRELTIKEINEGIEKGEI